MSLIANGVSIITESYAWGFLKLACFANSLIKLIFWLHVNILCSEHVRFRSKIRVQFPKLTEHFVKQTTNHELSLAKYFKKISLPITIKVLFVKTTHLQFSQLLLVGEGRTGSLIWFGQLQYSINRSDNLTLWVTRTEPRIRIDFSRMKRFRKL